MGEVSPLNELYRNYRDSGFEFLTIYVREPHPGEHYGAHRTWDQKLKYAQDCRNQDGIQTRVLIDDLNGTVHVAYGSLPNMVYIIEKSGKIVFKAMWTDHKEIESVLANLVVADRLRGQGLRVKPSFTERINYIPAEYAAGVRERVFGRAGPKAWQDYKEVFSSRS